MGTWGGGSCLRPFALLPGAGTEPRAPCSLGKLYHRATPSPGISVPRSILPEAWASPGLRPMVPPPVQDTGPYY